MTLLTRTLLIGFAYFTLTYAATIVIPALQGLELVTVLGGTIGIMGSYVAFQIFRREPNRKNSYIFINFFAFLFLLALLPHVTIGSRALSFISPYFSFYTFQYATSLFYFVLVFAIAYVVIDSLFRDIKTSTKYIVTFFIVGIFFASYFYPIFTNPKYLYGTPDVKDFATVSRAMTDLQEAGVTEITPELLASNVALPAWRGNDNIGTLHAASKVSRIRELMPYFEGDNFVMLVYKPLFLALTYMSVACLFLIVLFFGYQYKKDPPQGAYIEKIVFLFLPYCSLEILHNYGYVKSVEFDIYVQLYYVGLYLTLANLLLILIFFSLRLSFISSIKGEFYEQELVSDSEHISRWRDSVDNLIVRYFLDPKTLHGRLLAPREAKSKT